jgi:hypothetical protein
MRSLEQVQPPVTVYLRVALGAAFLSTVADRFGLWGPFGTPNVAWGEFGRFVAYVGKLNWFVPEGLWPLAACSSTSRRRSAIAPAAPSCWPCSASGRRSPSRRSAGCWTIRSSSRAACPITRLPK